jgi:hypothetical protein
MKATLTLSAGKLIVEFEASNSNDLLNQMRTFCNGIDMEKLNLKAPVDFFKTDKVADRESV